MLIDLNWKDRNINKIAFMKYTGDSGGLERGITFRLKI